MSSLRNASAVLKLFTPERTELSVTSVSHLLHMPKSSASRLLKAMLREGFLSNIGRSPRYRIGHLFFEVARLYGRSSSLTDLADEALSEVCRQTRHGGYISLLDGGDILVLRAYRGAETLRVVTPLGSRSPAYATANGRVLLARLSDDAVRALYPGELQPRSAHSPQTIEQLLRALDQIRQVGWCEAINEAVPDVGSVAVSIADTENGETLAFCVSFPAHIVSEQERRNLAAALIEAAKRIGTDIDDPFWTNFSDTRVVAA